MDKPEILFVCRKQFGYSVDNYYHCKYLKEDYLITYLSPYVGWEKINIDGVNPVYCLFRKNRVLNNIRFYYKVLNFIQQERYKLVILNRNYFFFLFKIFNPGKIFIYDIRSGIISSSAVRLFFYTLLIKLDLLFFRNITIISDSLADQMKIKHYHLLPLGAEKFELPPKKFKELRLVYVGSFNKRRIEDTVTGFGLFLNKFKGEKDVSYHIYGFGDPLSENKILDSINSQHLKEKVVFHGKILHEQLPDVLRDCNVGVSYIPLTSYFDLQPPTKTFEYLLAGMPVIATRTKENEKVINEYNGVLVKDNPEDFNNGLSIIYDRISANQYTSSGIIEISESYTWEKIVKNNLKLYIDSLLSNDLLEK